MSDAISRSVVRVHTPIDAQRARLSSGFLWARRSGGDDKIWLVTNEHAVNDAASDVSILCYDNGVQMLETIARSDFLCLAEGRQDLAIAPVRSGPVKARGYEWQLAPSAHSVIENTVVEAIGYPDGVDYAVSRRSAAMTCAVRQGSSDFTIWGRTFFVDGAWGPGWSGAPVFTNSVGGAVLLGVNRGVVTETQAANGDWVACGLSRIVDVSELVRLFPR